MTKRYIIVGLLFFGLAIAGYFFQQTRKELVSPVLRIAQFIPSSPFPEKDAAWTLVATGDVIPARSVNYKTLEQKDFTWSFKNIAPILQAGDITLTNLESPLIANCPVTNEGFTFCGDTRHVEGLLFAGVDVVSIANNHIGNYGIDGIQETTRTLEQHNMRVTGDARQPVTMHVKDTDIAFLAYNDIGGKEEGVAWTDEETMGKEIKAAKEKNDVVVVSMSWGVEYTDRPSERQQYLGHLAVDAGADLIIGNHPHWIQTVERYKGKTIMYAHGNTIFDQMWSEETRIGVIGKYTFLGNELQSAAFIPVYIENYGQPRLLTGQLKEKILEKLR